MTGSMESMFYTKRQRNNEVKSSLCVCECLDVDNQQLTVDNRHQSKGKKYTQKTSMHKLFEQACEFWAV